MDKNNKKVTVIGLAGTVLDAGKTSQRWERWRPTVAVCQHEDLLVDRFLLLHQQKYLSLAQDLQRDIGSVSPETRLCLVPVEFKDPWDFEEVYGALLDFARAQAFDPENEDYLVHITTGTHVAQICLFLLTESRDLPARLLQTSPPAGRFGDSPGTYRIIDLDLSKYDRIASRFQRQTRDDRSFLKSGIDTRNLQFNRLIEQIEFVAGRSSAPILLTGPTGAGKSRLARRIYELKKARRQLTGHFVEVNCATLRGDAAMSALFGHRKGAFTGAMQDRPGLLRAADNGLLLLDEIGELGVDEQAMLLRAVEEKNFLPLGADRPAESNFQLIAGTNRDLLSEVRQGKFREDLLARINLWTFRLPSLRERPEDVEPNLDYEMEQLAARTGIRAAFNKEARQRFLEFATSPAAEWTANFRDLNAAVTRLGILAGGERISAGLVEDEIGRLQMSWRRPAVSGAAGLTVQIMGGEKAEALDRFDRVQLEDVLGVCRSARTLSEAGRILFSCSRTHRQQVNDADRLRKYLTRFGLTWQAIRSGFEKTD